MKQIKFSDYQAGQHENVDTFALQLFHTIVFTEHARYILEVGGEERVVIYKDQLGHYYVRKATNNNDNEAWPMKRFHDSEKGFELCVSMIQTPPADHQKFLRIELSGRAFRGYDQYGVVDLYKIQAA